MIQNAMKKKCFIILFLVINVISFAQDNSFQKEIRASFMYIDALTWSPYSSSTSEIRENTKHEWGYALMLDADLWHLSRNFNAGLHLGFSPSSYSQPIYSTPSATEERPMIGVHYGMDISYNMLPDCNRWNISINGTLGSYWTLYKSPQVSYGASLRVEYFPLKHFGIFAETGWGKFYFTHQNASLIYYGETMSKIGLTFRQ